MVEDRPEDTGSLPDSDRPKREPPTIDLKATEVTSETAPASDAATPEAASRGGFGSRDGFGSPVAAPSAPVSPWIVAPVSGAVAAALVIGVGWMLGWPAIQQARTSGAAAQRRCDRRSHRARRGAGDQNQQARSTGGRSCVRRAHGDTRKIARRLAR